MTLAESFKIAAEYWPELVSLGLFFLGALALAAGQGCMAALDAQKYLEDHS